ncbi:MAG: hypothetical protein ACRDZ8_15885, partial [Acidimicrobiales bacterium]
GIASILHLAVLVHGRHRSFQPSSAGWAELVIGVVLAVAAAVVWPGGDGARPLSLAALGFTIVGFLVGLRFTATDGARPDIAYHLTTLPLLVAALVIVWRRKPKPAGKMPCPTAASHPGGNRPHPPSPSPTPAPINRP